MMNQRQCICVTKWTVSRTLLLVMVFTNVMYETQSFQIEFLQMVDRDHNAGKHGLPISVFKPSLKGASNESRRPLTNVTAQTKVEILSKTFKKSVQKIKHKNKRMDIVFLIDSSSSVGKNNFHSELKFVKKFLSDFNVSFNHTRVAIVTFSSQGKIVRHVDHITKASVDNDKCRLLNYEMPRINFFGGGTYTAGALLEAKKILGKGRKHSKKLVCLITDGFSNGLDPVPIAQKLKADNITVMTIGIQTGNSGELCSIASEPTEDHSFLLDSFTQFESLARKALHHDYKPGTSLRIDDSTLCDMLCDKPQMSSNETISCCDENAECTCSTMSGHYSCVCNPGFYGTGLVNQCQLCPNGTYWHSKNLCKPCPDANHITMDALALGISYCKCKSGFKATSSNQCEILTCPALEPPVNGYFVEHPTGCDHVMNTACGARCKPGYQLVGSSIRLCQENGTWSATEAKCVLKTCPSLAIPFYGMAVCKNPDLKLQFDYTPRNESFMEYYDRDEFRVTEPMPFDTDCSFKCGPGFYMVGSTKRNCLPLSKWDGLQTACKQILCPPLPEVTFGQYDPTDCTMQKMAHGTNCSLICDPGFEVKGVATKTCNGKRLGVWTNKNKYPKCVDVTPPELKCPDNFTVTMSEDDDFVIVKLFPEPIATDNSDGNVTYWIKPAVKAEGVKLTLGEHTFTYNAVDAFKNKAKCNFVVTVIDITPPVLENCIDPPEIRIPITPKADPKLSFIDWDPPIIYDNSNTELEVTQSIQPGFLGLGVHQIIYNATDPSGNHNSCVLNVIVKPMECEVLQSPANGQSLCAKNMTHTWCEITCDVGYAIFDELAENHMENFKLYCESEFAKWPYDNVPDCTQLELPEAIEQVFSITLNSEMPICNDGSEDTLKLQEEFRSQMWEQLCADSDGCEVVSEVPDCSELSTDLSNDLKYDPAGNTFYSIVKREIRQNRRNNSVNGPRQPNMKIRVYTRISKKLGLWDPKIPRSENIKRVKAELRTFHTNPELRQKLDSMRINIRHLNLDELTVCRNGSVSKKGACVQCPRGSFHNTALNICQLCPLGYYNNKTGRTECLNCRAHHSTRKLGNRFLSDCIEQCPPGTTAKIKVRANQKLQNSLVPFCRKCQPGQYQPLYNQIKCENCEKNHISPRGSLSASACYPKQSHPCFSHPAVCGPHGVCQQENGNAYLYSCLCQEEFIGSHCELQVDLCASAPCQNGGQCEQVNSASIKCQCNDHFSGDNCELGVDACTDDTCRNGGTCIDSNGTPICECAPGYEGKSCEIQHNFCSMNPCEAGHCLNSPEGYFCKCPPGIIGRRCHLRPCDYQPCHKNANCIDLNVFPASRNSFVCRCPAGLKGFDCSQIDSPCEAEPCRNNGVCIPTALRNATNSAEIFDDKLFFKYTCKCPPYFYGKDCEIFTTPDFVMEFSKTGVHNFLEIEGPQHSLKEISLCTWLQTNDSFNYGTILSYASESSDNMFTLTDYNGFVLYVSGNNIITDIQINDGLWHFICLSWSSEGGVYEIYVDGEMRDTGFNLSPGSLIEANGTLIVGQEQDSLGTSFSESESFIGRIAYLDVWKRFITTDEMLEYYTTCEPYQGDLYAWPDFKSKIKGNVKITSSPFCKPCPHTLRLLNGYIRYMGNSAFHTCYDGYRLQGSPRRDCLRTSQWSRPVPFCQSNHCGHLPSLANGLITIQKSESGEEARFTCNENYFLVGSQTRVCLSNGTWSGIDAECISMIECDRITTPTNSIIVYANDKGRINDQLLRYPMGTFVEIQCVNNTEPIGENFLSCTESGAWDLAPTQCVADDEQISLETTTSRQSKSSGLPVSSTPLPTNASLNEAPDKEFWMNLRRFFYHGCLSTEKNKQSEFCNQLTLPNNFTDLTNYESPNTDDFKNMDFKLVTYLKKAAALLKNDTISSGLNFENLFGFIIYGNLTQRQIALEDLKQSSSIETSFRLVVCFYIDSILLESDLHISTAIDNSKKLENITQRIKAYLLEIASVAYRNYRKTHPIVETSTRTNQKADILNRSSRSTLSDGDTTDEYDLYVDWDQLHSNVTYDYEDFLMDMTTSLSTFSSTSSSTSEIDSLTTTYSTEISSSSESSTSTIEATTSNSVDQTESTETIAETSVHGSSAMMNSNAVGPVLEATMESTLSITPVGCSLNQLPSKYNNSVIKIITIDETKTTINVTSNFTTMDFVPIKTKIELACQEGFLQSGENITACEDQFVWSIIKFSCKAIYCGPPSKPYDMTMNDIGMVNVYPVGHKLQLKCNPGYELVGSPFIYCTPIGKWSAVLSHCLKNSCPELLLPPNVKIVSSSLTKHLDNVIVSCSNGTTIEMKCQPNGIWYPDETTICGS